MTLHETLREHPEFVTIFKRFQSEAPVDVVGLATEIGLNVWEDDLPEGTSGKIFRDEINGGRKLYSIVIRADDPWVRKRFTVAHELSHYLLHRDQIGNGIEDNVLYRSQLSGRTEREANKLAGEILMPVNLIEAATSHDKNARAIAQALGVSETALKIRLGMPT